MKKKKLCLVIISLLLVLGVGGYKMIQYRGDNLGTAAAQQQNHQQEKKSDSLSSKIQLLRSEMKKDSSDYFEIKPVYDLLEQVLSKKESISLSPEDIMGDETKYYLKYLDEISIGETKQRIIAFGPKATRGEIPTLTSYYVQSWTKDGICILQKLRNVGESRRGGFVTCNVFKSGDSYYIPIIRTVYVHHDRDEGIISLEFYTYKYDGTRWVEYSWTSTYSANKRGEWVESECTRTYDLDHNKARIQHGVDYTVKLSDNKADIALVDKNKQVLDTVQIVFQNGRWGIK